MVPFFLKAAPRQLPATTDNRERYPCRACRLHYETPEHVIIRCVADNHISDSRNKFFGNLPTSLQSTLPMTETDQLQAFHLLKDCIYPWHMVPITARFFHDLVNRWRAFSFKRCGSKKMRWRVEMIVSKRIAETCPTLVQ
ncbi:hypothetical protein E1B28_009750 [Marasmius oreades]|uniref:Uncharacterized protein n=1 Tax=Marasmius oreades TaxID=181124 RepID=A0A9P7USY5_9AGAR|nr:uncharacterized protein E1B28_009750 [Marasmius oreades]KAG7090649.1 hypothetical protein E1B28_009750 [Marasmius oreades]